MTAATTTRSPARNRLGQWKPKPEEPRDKLVAFRVSTSEREMLDDIAAKRGISLSDTLREGMDTAIRRAMRPRKVARR